ncbi:E3 ubiquitin-protein ligase RGLG3-like [Ananas comosus]|uniref:E3 ubiquitin-protein ligase RGLG3-like n=1 Tax=Ananas comosus TaxID=4615 RepID=A0A6P5G2M8_ANACO|nr:E3 ubiquitin-protein ligase RGLG3-like [Ananas comosus]XP_020099526.1 E3 ubiquitin-protein ligase RGLG3-like [Ananas comosus]
MGNAKSTEFSHPYNYHSQESFSVCRRAGDKNTKKQQPAFIADNFNSLDEVITALRDAGLESSNLILGIDFTKSNEWTGRHSFNRRSLHSIGDTPNPYEQAISIIGRTLASFDDDNLIPCFGFGDVTTRDEEVFSFFPDHRPCRGFAEALSRYREIVPYLTLSGPTSFAPLILAAVDIVERSHGQYHVLVIVADGQVSGGSTQPNGGFSQQEQATIDAIVYASYYPLSIIMVGVGDGPWDAMQQFDDFVPRRSFDNFQFVNFTKIMSGNMTMEKKEAAFALSALMEIPFQYRATQALVPTEKSKEITGERKPLRPPCEVIEHDNATASREFTKNIQPMEYNIPQEKACFICFANPKDMAFGCGHLTCRNCGMSIDTCPLCRAPVTSRVRLFPS